MDEKLKFVPLKHQLSPPKRVTDNEVKRLYDAFESETRYPTILNEALRPTFWQCVIDFVSETAARREAVLGVKWNDIFTDADNQLVIRIREEIDKKNVERIKPITLELFEHLKQIKTDSEGNIFDFRNIKTQKMHVDKTWYRCWNEANSRAGTRLKLHDIKRYSGILAMRAGADIMTLTEHMDHKDYNTTRRHYCRPETREIVEKMQKPFQLSPPPPAAGGNTNLKLYTG
jgi:integrase